MSDTLTTADFEALRKIDTPTICNLLEMCAPEVRGFGFTFQHLHCIFPTLLPIVGYAKTATVRARRPSLRTPDQVVESRGRYLAYIEDGDSPKVSVVQDLDEQPGYGALWGEVMTAVHKSLNVQGAVTNGSVRDLDMIAPGFQLLAGVIAPSHAYVHIVDFGSEVNVHGMTVNDGDLIHADRHGAVIIPHAVAKEVPKQLDLMLRREKLILDVARAPSATAAKLAEAWFRSATSIRRRTQKDGDCGPADAHRNHLISLPLSETRMQFSMRHRVIKRRLKFSSNIGHRAVEHNGVIYLSGFIAEDLSAGMVGQTEQILRKIEETLFQLGSSKEQLLTSTIFLADFRAKTEMNSVWVKWFNDSSLPTRSTIGVADLGPGVLIEVVVSAATQEQ